MRNENYLSFDDLVAKITHRQTVTSQDLLPFLCLETREDRCMVNRKLAEAYFGVGNLSKAKVFIHRAWILSKFSSKLLPLYLKIHSASGDTDLIQEAYKRLGMKKSLEGKIADAIEYFRLSMYAHVHYDNIDKFRYDFDILERIEMLAYPHRFKPTIKDRCLEGRKIRLAYLMYGVLQTNSVIVKINSLFARYHDKTRFDVVFFVPDQNKSVFRSPQGKEYIKELEGYNWKVVIPTSDTVEDRLFEVAGQIYNYRPDILITHGLLAHPTNYFIAALQPAPVIIGFSNGPPPQFVSHTLDWSIAWTKHPLIDCPCDCSQVNLEIGLPEVDASAHSLRRKYNLPEKNLILMSGGRHHKFQYPELWVAIAQILKRYDHVSYVVFGLDKIPLCVEELVEPEIRKRMVIFKWRTDYIQILKCADIVIDTFPSGGGVLLMDAMSLGIPVITFKNDYIKLYDQLDWSPGEEFVPYPELVVDRDDFTDLTARVSQLIEDNEYRAKMAELCREKVRLVNGDAERMVRKCEDIYVKVLEKKLQQRGNSGGIRESAFIPIKSEKPEDLSGNSGAARHKAAFKIKKSIADFAKSFLKLR